MKAGNKVVLISGANPGIGRAFCLEALSCGYELQKKKVL